VKAMLATSKALQGNRIREKLEARMRKAPRKYCIKRCANPARRMAAQYLQSKGQGKESGGPGKAENS